MIGPTTARDMLQGARSWLFVPGHLADRWLEKAGVSEADVLILDLEDGVLPARKDEARETARTALAQARPRQPVAVRINGLTTPWWTDDLAMAVSAGVAAVILPKAAAVGDVERLAAALDDLAPGPAGVWPRCAIVPLLETASGILHAEAIAAAGGVAAVAFGGEDLAADLGVIRSDGGVELQHARGHLVLACAAAGRGAIDTPTLDPSDIALVSAEAVAARAIGFTGKLAIHPRQVPAINAAFEPRENEIRLAKAIIEGFEQAVRSGSGIVVVEGRMVDEPVVAAARRLVARARAAGNLGR
jgi:citrate lyase subunit beta / citryl-CoA lyase